MNADESNHSGHTTGTQTLLENATVTIRFDGLIYTTYDERVRLCQAAVYTNNIDHHLTIEVKDGEGKNAQQLFHSNKWPDWEEDYDLITTNAPFWLYVDSGNGLHPKEFSAQLHLPTTADERSFDKILNFQKLYDGRKITLDTSKFAEFNFPHGTCYSAENKKAKKTKVDASETPISKEEEITVSTKGAIDINLASDQTVKREIVLVNKDGQKLFQFPLENGKHYFIDVVNGPKEHVGIGHAATRETNGQKNHFLRYYELFELQDGEQRFEVIPKEEEAAVSVNQGPVSRPRSVNSPPCISGSGDRVTGLP